MPSLQLLYSIILNSGQTFRSGEKFVWAIRQYLCVSLLKNGVSPIATILQLSLDIFVAVIRAHRAIELVAFLVCLAYAILHADVCESRCPASID